MRVVEKGDEILGVDCNVLYFYRDQLKRNYNLNNYSLEVDLDDLRNFDEELSDLLVKKPTDYLPLVSE